MSAGNSSEDGHQVLAPGVEVQELDWVRTRSRLFISRWSLLSHLSIKECSGHQVYQQNHKKNEKQATGSSRWLDDGD